VTKELRFRPVARDFERRFAAAREAYQRNDPHAALRQLGDARAAAARRRDEDQLRRVLDFAEGAIARDNRTEIERESLLYAVRQNLRQLTRRRALLAGESWEDPFPDLAAPRPHTRTFISRSHKVWIGVAVLFGTFVAAAFVAGFVAGLFDSGGPMLALRIRNDTGRQVTVDWCDTVACTGGARDTLRLGAGSYTREDLSADDVVDLFVIHGGAGRSCLPVRVDRTYEGLANKKTAVVVRVSQATPCPGTIVTPSLVAN
jgi:hypothetical protein